eukprot:2799178-Rhodomonas_salina.3
MINNNIVIPQLWLVVGLLFFLVAVPIGMFVVYSFVEGCVALGLIFLLFLYLFYFNTRSTFKSYSYLDRKIHSMTQPDKTCVVTPVRRVRNE